MPRGRAFKEKSEMRHTIHASYTNPDDAARAVAALMDNGIHHDDISVYVKNRPQHWGEEPTGVEVVKTAEEGLTTTTAADAASGSLKGAGVGLGVGILAGLAAITIPGAGLVIGGGALATAVAGALGATAAGAVAGGAYGYLSDQGVHEDAVHRMTTTVDEGGALVSVACPSGTMSAEKIEAILAKYEAHEVAVPPMQPVSTSTQTY